MDGDIVIGSSEGTRDALKDIEAIEFTIRTISTHKEIAKMLIRVPVSTWELIELSRESWNYESEDPMFKAYKLLFNVSNIDEAIHAFQRLKNSRCNEIVYCSKNNIKELRKAKKQLINGLERVTLAVR